MGAPGSAGGWDSMDAAAAAAVTKKMDAVISTASVHLVAVEGFSRQKKSFVSRSFRSESWVRNALPFSMEIIFANMDAGIGWPWCAIISVVKSVRSFLGCRTR